MRKSLAVYRQDEATQGEERQEKQRASRAAAVVALVMWSVFCLGAMLLGTAFLSLHHDLGNAGLTALSAILLLALGLGYGLTKAVVEIMEQATRIMRRD